MFFGINFKINLPSQCNGLNISRTKPGLQTHIKLPFVLKQRPLVQ